VRGCNVYRSVGDDSRMELLTEKPVPGTRFADASAERGKTYVYVATSVEWSGLESSVSSPSLKVVTAAGQPQASSGPPLSGWDKTPPRAVEGFSARRDEDGDVWLQWTPSPEPDLRHYHIYFSDEDAPQPAQKWRTASPPAGTSRYIHWDLPQKGTAFYVVTAVDRQGNESEPARFELWTP